MYYTIYIMIPLLYIGIISFSGSFLLSFSVTTEYLRMRTNFLLDQMSPKKKSTSIKFNNVIRFKYIEPRDKLSSTTLSKLWYTKEDYQQFQEDYKRESKYHSI